MLHKKLRYLLLLSFLPLLVAAAKIDVPHKIASIEAPQISDLRKQLHKQVDVIVSKLQSRDAASEQKAHTAIDNFHFEDSLASFVGNRMTPEEMSATAAFLETPAGRKFLTLRKEMDLYFMARGSLLGLEAFDQLKKGHPTELHEDSATASMRKNMRETLRNLDKGKKQ